MQMSSSAEESAIRKDFRGCCRQIALGGLLVAFLIPAIVILGLLLLDFGLFKRNLTIQEMAYATGLFFPEGAECRRFRWVIYFNADGWMAEIRFPAKHATIISDSVFSMMKSSSVSREESSLLDNGRNSFSAIISQENWIGCFPSPSETRFSVNAWMTTNETFGTIVLGYVL